MSDFAEHRAAALEAAAKAATEWRIRCRELVVHPDQALALDEMGAAETVVAFLRRLRTEAAISDLAWEHMDTTYEETERLLAMLAGDDE